MSPVSEEPLLITDVQARVVAELARISPVTDELGLSRESLTVPLAMEGDGRVARTRTGRIEITLPDDLLRRIDCVARLDGETRGDFLRRAAERELAERRTIPHKEFEEM